MSKNFSAYLEQMRKNLAQNTGREYSTIEITEVLSQFRPSINIQQKKRRASILDF